MNAVLIFNQKSMPKSTLIAYRMPVPHSFADNAPTAATGVLSVT